MTEEPSGLIAGKMIKVKPHIPYYLADGNVVLRKWKESFTDRMGNKAELTKVVFRTKKNKENVAVIRVKWE